MKQFVYLFVGPPSSGKGTQSEMLASKEGIPRIDVGAILRERANKEDATASAIRQIMQAGKTLPDKTIRPIVEPIILQRVNAKGLVLDGYCRTLEQVEHLHSLVASKKIPPVLVIKLTVNEQEAVKRMEHRRYCSGCNAQQYLVTDAKEAVSCLRCGGHLTKRADDDLAVFTERLKTYHRKTVPAVKELSRLFTTITIDGEKSIESVHLLVTEAISHVTT